MNLKIASKSAKTVFDISSMVDGEVTWTTERNGGADKLEFNLIKNGNISYLEGDTVYFRADKIAADTVSPAGISFQLDGVDAFKGYVFKKVKAQESIKTTCYDQLFQMKQCKQSYNIKDMTVVMVIEMIAKEFGFDTGELVPVEYVLPKKLYDNQSLLDIVLDCVNRTTVETGKVYNFYDCFGKLTLKEATSMKLPIILGNESFVTDYTYTTTLEETYNYIKLVKANEQSGRMDTYVVKDDKSMDEWGMLQYYEKIQGDMNPAQIEKRAKQLFDYYGQKRRKLSLTAVGIADIRAGSMVLVDIKGLGDIDLSKILLINKCVHKFSSGGHMMDLEMEVYNG